MDRAVTLGEPINFQRPRQTESEAMRLLNLEASYHLDKAINAIERMAIASSNSRGRERCQHIKERLHAAQSNIVRMAPATAPKTPAPRQSPPRLPSFDAFGDENV